MVVRPRAAASPTMMSLKVFAATALAVRRSIARRWSAAHSVIRMIVSLKSPPRLLSAITWFKVRLSSHKKTPVADRSIGSIAVLGGNEAKAWSVMAMRTMVRPA
jgi:hypothetical protein